jgi:hypothetical protein
MFAHTYLDLRGLFQPLRSLDRRLHPYCYAYRTWLNEHELVVRWTQRAHRELAKRDRPLEVEMQLYFSCVVKKRVLFHDRPSGKAAIIPGGFAVHFRPVEASSCDPLEFAQAYPERRVLSSPAAQRMHPRTLDIDFVQGEWQGSFAI